MNISQHSFVPRGRNLNGFFYSLSGNLSNSPFTSTTFLQSFDFYNCFQLFGNFAPLNGNWLSLRLFSSSDSSENGYVGNTSTGYQLPLLQKTPITYTSCAFTFRNNFYHGFPVLSVMWYEFPTSSSVRLTFANTLIDAL